MYYYFLMLNKSITFLTTLILVIFSFLPFTNQNPLIPVTYLQSDIEVVEKTVDKVTLASSIASLVDSTADSTVDATSSDGFSLTGIYIKNALQLSVVQQPAGQPGYVSTSDGNVTQFGSASQYGSIGLLAHNYLAGRQFFAIANGDEIDLVYGDGRAEKYIVSEVRKYQALSPTSPYSSFVDLSQPDVTLTYEDLFYDTYGVGGRLILQTCISNNGSDSWGRLFIIANRSD